MIITLGGCALPEALLLATVVAATSSDDLHALLVAVVAATGSNDLLYVLFVTVVAATGSDDLIVAIADIDLTQLHNWRHSIACVTTVA